MTAFQKTALLAVFFLLSATVHAQINVSTTLIQSNVEMLWEAHSYIPPFYKGKSLYPISGEVAVFVVPPTSLGNPATLTYTWKKDGQVLGSLSGVGKRSYTFGGSQFGGAPLIMVTVSNGTTAAQGVLRLEEIDPVLRFYENKPLEGVLLENALPNSFTTREKDMTIEAYPYFFSVNSLSEAPVSYRWSANSQPVSDARGARVTVHSEEPRTILMRLSTNHLTEILQSAERNVTIVFE